MTQEIATTQDRGLWNPAKESDFTPEERDEMRALQPGLEKASDADLRKLFTVSKQADLNPYLKEVYLVPRYSKSGTVWSTQTSIDGFRKATHRYANAKGLSVNISRAVYYDENGSPRPFWSKKFGPHPEAAEVTVQVGDSSATVVCTWDEYVQTMKSGEPNPTWAKLGPTMLAKCAEAGAHRRVCPLTAGLYIAEEMPAEQAVVHASAERVNTAHDSTPSIAQATVVDEPLTVDEIVSVINTCANEAELEEQKEFIFEWLSTNPAEKDTINKAWMDKKDEWKTA